MHTGHGIGIKLRPNPVNLQAVWEMIEAKSDILWSTVDIFSYADDSDDTKDRTAPKRLKL